MVFVVLQLAATAMLAGMCWTVQFVVYPQFANVPRSEFPPYHAQHMRRITWVVAPLMLAELLLGIWLVAWPATDPLLGWSLLGMTAVIWLSTGLIQVPLHALLEHEGQVRASIERLVRSNWIRTLGWTARTVVLAGVLIGWAARAPSG